jgi:C-terminal processing protease CtpA/Prc
MTNRWCASSCESLLFLAKESDKTIIVGENSGGYVGYGEVGEIETPCYNFDLTCTMTRYKKQRAYEVIGIEPDIMLDKQKDWIEQTIKFLEKK